MRPPSLAALQWFTDLHNVHHVVEAVFKALGRALDQATRSDPRIEGALSTKGYL